MKPSIELIRLFAVILITFTHTRHDLESGFFYLIIEKLPLYGTAILSLISGYLYYSVSRKSKNLFQRKIKSLALPYLIANTGVLILVLLFNFVFGYNPLNRLTYDISIVSEGILALNSPPINPPTYFIRDIFIVFSIIALFTQKEYKAVFVIVPFLLLGTLILRMDVAFLFTIGLLYAKFEEKIDKKWILISNLIVLIIISIWFVDYLKFPISFLIFVSVLDLNIKLFNTGRYSYLLHLYHSPIIVITYPILNTYIDNTYIKLFAQIFIAVFFVFLLFLITKKIKFLKILSGGR